MMGTVQMGARLCMCLVALAALVEAKRFTAIDAHVHLITTTNGVWSDAPHKNRLDLMPTGQ